MTTESQRRAAALLTQLGWQPHQAAGILGNLVRESGQNLDTRVVHDNGTGYGIAGWRDPQPGRGRRTDLFNFAQRNNLDPHSLDGQIRFLDHELRTTEASAGAALRASRNPAEAATAMISYERPGGWTRQNPQGTPGLGGRIESANSAYEAINGRWGGPQGLTLNSAPGQAAMQAPAAPVPGAAAPLQLPGATDPTQPGGMTVSPNTLAQDMMGASNPMQALGMLGGDTRTMGGIATMMRGLSGQGGQAQQRPDTNIGPLTSGMNDGGRMQAGAQLMSNILQKRKTSGLSMMG